MRRLPLLCLPFAALLPASAFASPLARSPFLSLEPAAESEPAAGSPTAGGVDYTPTSSKAPDSQTPPPTATPEPEPEEVPEPEGPEDDTTALDDPAAEEPAAEEEIDLDSERKKASDKGAFNQHGVGARGGITVIPSWILGKFLATHGNALCRGGNIGNFAEKRGLIKQQGCNFYVGGEYVYRRSRIFDIVAAVGYQHARAPDSYWLDNGEWASDCTVNDNGRCNLSAADYTEVKLGMVFLEADFIARAPVVLTQDVELGIGGGAGIGLGIVTGGVYQTALGSGPAGYTNGMVQNTCQRLEDLGDFTRCTPRYDPTETPNDPNFVFNPNDLSDPNPGNFARCTKDKCDTGDLEAFGYRKKQGDIPPVVPVVNLILSVRLIVKDVFGITLNGGFQTGFYFGANMNYFFGKDMAKNKKKGGPAGGKAEARRKLPRAQSSILTF